MERGVRAHGKGREQVEEDVVEDVPLMAARNCLIEPVVIMIQMLTAQSSLSTVPVVMLACNWLQTSCQLRNWTFSNCTSRMMKVPQTLSKSRTSTPTLMNMSD